MPIRPCRLLILVMLALWSAASLAAAPLPVVTPHGILADRALPLAHYEDLDGSPDAPAAGLARWRQTLHELQRSAEHDLSWPDARQVQVAGLAKGGRNQVALALIHARYDRLDDQGALRDAEVLALGALRQDVYYGADLSLSLDPARIFTHGTSPLVALTLDPGDGGGPRPLEPGVPLAVSYKATGVRTLTLSARLDDGRTLTARTVLDVKRLATPEPTETWSITATESWGGQVAGGQAYVYLAPGHTGPVNPVVVVEGFDLDNSMDWPVLYDLLNQQNMLEDLRADGFDAVVLDFTEATEPIQRNAFVLTELLAQVAAAAPGRSQVLIGASMGGLVSRYALLWLEEQGLGHQVRTYLSFDSPHGGANIPLGLQHWLEFFQGESEEAAFLLSRLDTPASRQMLLYHHLASSGTSAGADPLRAAWLADLAANGSWPQDPRLVAVANGSGTGQDQGFAAGAQIIAYTYRSLLVDIDGDVWAVPDGPGQLIFDGGINLIWPLPDTYRTVSVVGTLPWDSAPGGYRGSMAQMDATTAPYGDIVALHDNHGFIPTVSALALEGVGPFWNIAGDPDLLTRTAFDQVYWPDANQEHIALTAQNKAWFLDEIRAGLSAVDDLPQMAAGGPVLLPAAPNPFNPRTRIRFRLETAGPVTLRIYDLAGRLVRTLVDGRQLEAGQHEVAWTGRSDQGQVLASGLYFPRLQVGDEVRTGRVVLAK